MRMLLAVALALTGFGCAKKPPPLPTVVVVAEAVGLSLAETENTVGVPVERALAELPKVDRVHTTVEAGLSTTSVWLRGTNDPLVASQAARGALEPVQKQLPGSAMLRTVRAPEAGGRTLYGVLRDEKLTAVDAFSQFRRTTEVRSNVLEVRGCGAAESQLVVLLDPTRLPAFGLTAREVSDAVGAAGIEVPGGRAEHQLRVNTAAPPTPEAVMETELASLDGASIRVKDVASVSRLSSKPECRTFAATPGVAVALRLGANADVETVKSGVADVGWYEPLTTVRFSVPNQTAERAVPAVRAALAAVPTVTDVVCEASEHRGGLTVVDARVVGPQKLKGQLVHDLVRAVEATPGTQVQWVYPGNAYEVTVRASSHLQAADAVQSLRRQLKDPWVLWLGDESGEGAWLQSDIDRDRAAALHVTANDIARTLQLASDDGESPRTGVLVRVDTHDLATRGDVQVAKGVPLSQVMSMTAKTGRVWLRRDQRQPAAVLYVGSEIGEKDLRSHLDAVKLGAGVSLEVRPFVP